MQIQHGLVTSGHTDARRSIWDIIQEGNAGGGHPLHQLGLFDINPGNQIGGARAGYGHYHEAMSETYVIISGTCVMSLRDMTTNEVMHIPIDVALGAQPYKVEVPPRVAHRLTATTRTSLLIAATGPQVKEDTIEAELPVAS